MHQLMLFSVIAFTLIVDSYVQSFSICSSSSSSSSSYKFNIRSISNKNSYHTHNNHIRKHYNGIPTPSSALSTAVTSIPTTTTTTTDKKDTQASPSSASTSTSNGRGLFNRIRCKIQNVSNNVNDIFNVQLPMLKYLWPEDNVRLKMFLLLSLAFMFLGKWINVKVPFMLQMAVDSLSKSSPAAAAFMTSNSSVKKILPASLALMLYGISRALSVVFSEAKTCIFAHVSQNVLRKFANQIFNHLHALDSEFHLGTPSGTLSVAYVRAVRGFQTMLFQIVFSVAPTILELYLVSTILYHRCGPIFAGITLATFTIYLAFTVWITSWRVSLRNELVEVDNARNGYFIDSILNHEVVKLFTNEKRELAKFDSYLVKIQDLSISSTYAIAVLNLGQATMFGIGLTASLLTALGKVNAGLMSIGDLVAVNSMLLQLSVPFNFMGYTYQEIRQAYVDMGYIRYILANVKPSISDNISAPDIDTIASRNGPSTVEFRNVSFKYASAGNSSDDLLKDVSFSIPSGSNVAIVGPSGSGKSTTLRLITRMLDPSQGAVLIDGVDTRSVSLESLRRRIAVVPQDTSLFDDTIEYNLLYSNVNATKEEIANVIHKCNLEETVSKLPKGLHTVVGERGARLSGGERQKVSIARAMLKDPTLILCDEVTSSVDAFAERDIVETLKQATVKQTTITIAHRLSSITHCDKIIVIDRGVIVEEGSHQGLLQIKDGIYKRMWSAQNDPDYKILSSSTTYDKESNDISNGSTSSDGDGNRDSASAYDKYASMRSRRGMDTIRPKEVLGTHDILKKELSLPATLEGRVDILATDMITGIDSIANSGSSSGTITSSSGTSNSSSGTSNSSSGTLDSLIHSKGSVNGKRKKRKV